MLGSLLRLVMLAGTGASIASGIRSAMVRLAAVFAVALVLALTVAVAIGAFGAAIFYELTPDLGPAGGAAAAGAVLLLLAAIIGLVCAAVYRRKRRRVSAAAGAAGLSAGLGGPLGAAALGASMGSGAMPDIKGMLGRHAVTVLLTAFIAGMVMNNRR